MDQSTNPAFPQTTDEITEALHIAAFSYWLARRGRKFAPGWADFNLMDLPAQAVPCCAVVDVFGGGDDQPDFVYRFFGTELVNRQGGELTGKSIRMIADDEQREQYNEACGIVLSRRSAVIARHESDINLFDFRYRSTLFLPLSSDGEIVDMIFTMLALGNASIPPR